MKHLMILEVSQKQAYIFSSVELKDNIAHSEHICQVTDPEYFRMIAEREGFPFFPERSLVYSGGGHTVLEFDSGEEARDFAYLVSRTVKKEFPGIALFIKTMAYDQEKTPGENLKELSKKLEEKKAVRQASFGQGSFGIERIGGDLRKAVEAGDTVGKAERGKRILWKPRPEPGREGFLWEGELPKRFDQLGNVKNQSSFIAVVHIDGNSMGKRVEEIRKANEGKDWDEYKEALKTFSQSVDAQFKCAYWEMMEQIRLNLEGGVREKLDLPEGCFPVRKIILAGDDVCFVAEGRIGLEAARIFIEKLSAKANCQDGKSYRACAGVAIVHQKYPFYKAYELSEMLCANAKSFVASYQEKGGASVIDWHIEFGELADSVEELREAYETRDGKRLELRPYLLSADQKVWESERERRYDRFRQLMVKIQNEQIAYARGKFKNLREALKAGEKEAEYYLKSNLIHELALVGYEREIRTDRLFQGEGLERKIFVKTQDGKERSLYFDAIELLDAFIPLDGMGADGEEH